MLARRSNGHTHHAKALRSVYTLHRYSSQTVQCALSLAAQCIVIGPVYLCVCVFVGLFVCLWVCYHDNSKLHASIFTKLGP